MYSLWNSWLIDLRSREFFILVISFAAISIFVLFGITKGLDISVNNFFISIQGNSILDIIFVVIASIGDIVSLVMLAIVMTIIRRTRKMGMIFLVVIVIIVIIVMYFKPFIGQNAPEQEFAPSDRLIADFTLEQDSLAPFARQFSYPSNHIASAASFAYIIGYGMYGKSKVAGRILWIFPILMGFARMYVMQHFITDIIGGFLLGLTISIVFSNLLKIYEPFQISRFKRKIQDKD